ncbi:MAG: acylneuraminate cytidylyltransferase family protein [Deltaproteobacteria bacterium]|nr:acylneuraminate cytidylyltransferase family protein [Deltaproteobacteria bacterium]
MGKIICIIPARGGSKGLPGKNIKPFLNKPLIAHTIEHAKCSESCDVIWVATDSPHIQKVAIEFGAQCPQLRSEELSQDLTPTEPVLKHALMSAESHFKTKFEIIVFLQCTDVFRKPHWIRDCVQALIKDPKLESAFYAYETHKNFWYEDKPGHYKRVLPFMAVYGPRQTRTPLYREDTGLACATRRDLILQEKRTGDYVKIFTTKDFRTSIDIHTSFDFWLAEQVYNYVGKS